MACGEGAERRKGTLLHKLRPIKRLRACWAEPAAEALQLLLPQPFKPLQPLTTSIETAAMALTFTVRRREAELVVPAEPTPRFVFALRLNHAICDAIGIIHSPCPTFPHHEVFDAVAVPPPPPLPPTFTFLPSNIDALRKRLPPNLRDTATTFELLAAALWRARTAALELSGDEHVRLMFICNIRGIPELGLPAGYYGNAAVPTAALVTVEALLAGTLGDTVELVREAKAAVTAEYVRSMLDLLVLRGRPYVAVTNLFVVSGNRRTGFHGVDFGYVLGVRNGGDGENNAAALPIMLPRPAMDRFASEVERLFKGSFGGLLLHLQIEASFDTALRFEELAHGRQGTQMEAGSSQQMRMYRRHGKDVASRPESVFVLRPLCCHTERLETPWGKGALLAGSWGSCPTLLYGELRLWPPCMRGSVLVPPNRD
nr:unnamed protein product [Digitaria exilis]